VVTEGELTVLTACCKYTVSFLFWLPPLRQVGSQTPLAKVIPLPASLLGAWLAELRWHSPPGKPINELTRPIFLLPLALLQDYSFLNRLQRRLVLRHADAGAYRGDGICPGSGMSVREPRTDHLSACMALVKLNPI